MGRLAYGRPELWKRMNEEDFLDGGYMLEANRQFFHPLGLQLIAQVAEDGLRLQVLDHRELTAGLLMEPDEELAESRCRKIAKVGIAWETRAQRRLARYGWIIQPPELFCG